MCKQISFNFSKNEITYKLCANKWQMLNCVCYIAILEKPFNYIQKKISGLYKNVIYNSYIQHSLLGFENTQTESLQRGKISPLNECPGYDIK